MGLGTDLYMAASHEEQSPLVCPKRAIGLSKLLLTRCGKVQLQPFAHEIKHGGIPGESTGVHLCPGVLGSQEHALGGRDMRMPQSYTWPSLSLMFCHMPTRPVSSSSLFSSLFHHNDVLSPLNLLILLHQGGFCLQPRQLSAAHRDCRDLCKAMGCRGGTSLGQPLHFQVPARS